MNDVKSRVLSLVNGVKQDEARAVEPAEQGAGVALPPVDPELEEALVSAFTNELAVARNENLAPDAENVYFPKQVGQQPAQRIDAQQVIVSDVVRLGSSDPDFDRFLKHQQREVATTTEAWARAILVQYEAGKLGLSINAYLHIMELEGRIARLEAASDTER